QIRGELVDARADLYALGCMLYELICGRPPFVAPELGAVLRQHLAGRVVPASELVEGVPPRLDALLLRLLAKPPAERLGYADDVAAVLAELGAEPAPPIEPRPRAYLYRPRFVGREKLLETFGLWLAEARAGSGRIALLGGESGVGKTRLALETARLA